MSGAWQASAGGAGWRKVTEGVSPPSGTLHSTSPGTGWLHEGESRRRVTWTIDGAGIWITVDGRTVLFRRAPRVSQGSSGGSLASPMPARILRLEVKVGQRVSAGDVLLVLEAMKMEHALKAPRDGIVKALRAGVGDQVAAGMPLVELT